MFKKTTDKMKKITPRKYNIKEFTILFQNFNSTISTRSFQEKNRHNDIKNG